MLVLVDLSDVPYGLSMLRMLGEAAATNREFVRARAVIGIPSVALPVVAEMARFSGRPIEAFADRTAALDWLASQREPAERVPGLSRSTSSSSAPAVLSQAAARLIGRPPQPRSRDMTPLFKKLNLKEQREILVINAPESFARELDQLAGVRVHRAPGAVQAIDFLLAFATRRAELDSLVAELTPKAADDAVLWFAYPKKTSKRCSADFDRDTGWAALGAAGFEPVRQVAIDEDWSALRFRRAEHIKSMKRAFSRALSEQGHSRASKPER